MRLESNIQCHFTPDADTIHEPVECGVCGTVMTENRDCYGPTSYGMAMAGLKKYYDAFVCPHSGELWHMQVIALRQQMQKTPSAVIEEILRKEAEQVLETRQCTKEAHWIHWTTG